MSHMELLEQLENRVTSILSRLETLEQEKKQLQERCAALEEMEQANQHLREELEQEKAAKAAVVDRIDGLLQKIAEHTPDF